jgi:hypothetical protein
MPKGSISKETVETRSYDKQFFLWANSLNFWVAPRIRNAQQIQEKTRQTEKNKGRSSAKQGR